MLKVENISTGYGKKQVLFDVSFEVNKGEIVLLAGSNGSGKSTLLKAIYGLLPLWDSPLERGKGCVIFEGENITGKPASALLKKGLLYVPQKNNLFEDLTVKENLEMAGLIIAERKELQMRIEYALSVFTALIPLLNRIPMKLSGGEQKLLVLAMATLHQPKIILIDEPFVGLSINRPEVNVYSENIKEKNFFGSYFYGLANNSWGQLYGGLIIKPFNWALINLGSGIEVNSNPYRININFILKYKKILFYQFYEYGGSGFWYNIAINTQVRENVKAGILFKRYYGLGPNINYSIKKTPFSITMAPLYDLEFKVPRGMILLRYSY